MYYKLVNLKPVKCGIEEMSDDNHCVVALDNIGDIKISTVFLGINHQCDDGPPILFETMVFGNDQYDYQQRYSTWEEAQVGHQDAVKFVKIKKAKEGMEFGKSKRELDI